MDVGGRQMTLETGEIGRQANGAVNLTYGDTVLYTTACCSLEATGDGSFIPLQVNYTERFSAAGKTSGGFIKRDGRSRESEVLVSRLTDRPIRPMFETGWNRETQLLTWVLSYDGEQSPEPLAITAAGAALAVSDIPLKKAVAGVRVGLLPELGFVVNPTVQQMEESKLDLIMAGTDSAVLMIEGYCDFLTEDQMLEAVGVGSEAIGSMCRSIAAWAEEVGKPKLSAEADDIQPIIDSIQEAVGSRFEEVYRNTHLKQERGAQIEAIRSEVFATYATKQGSDSSLVATTLGAAAASLGGLGGLGPSTSNPEVDPSTIGAEEEEEEDETVPEAPEPAADLSLKKSTGVSASSSADSPSRPPPDEEDSQTSTSGSKSIADPIIQTGVGAAARGLGGVGGLGQSNSEQEEEGAASSEPSQISSADLAKDPIVQTAIGAAALGLGGVGGLGRTSSEPSPPPGEEEEGSSGKVLPMGTVGATPAQVSRALKEVASHTTRRLVLEEGYRVDGRGVTDVRPIWSRAGCLPRVHGSALFTRGETQALAVTTLGSDAAAQRQDSMSEDYATGKQNFYLQYFFPPSSVGETGRTGGMPGRREVGHGMLAQRALAPIVPDEEEFPYTIRLESTITESNGSSSMASVCGGCLAMMDAGVPIKRMVAGVAMGLILEEDGQFIVLTDILGSEDALGDMDFKVAGDAEGVTAFQMDIKVEGITLEVMRQALDQAKAGRQHILREMQSCDPPPAKQLSQYAPRIRRFNIDPDKIGQVIGSGGRNIKMLQAAAGCDEIMVSDQLTGLLEVRARTDEAALAGEDIIVGFLTEPEAGAIFRNVAVGSVMPFGCIVDFAPGKSGLVHVSELDVGRTADPTTVWKAGDKIDVKILEYDKASGRCKLSRKAVMQEDSGVASASAPQPVEIGATYRDVEVVKVQQYGCFVALNSQVQALVHVSELDVERVSDPASLFQAGDRIDVKVLDKNKRGQLQLSRKQVQIDDNQKELSENGNGNVPSAAASQRLSTYT
ncbi:hypothetical protein WJX77_011122 [Trebouxia sp. C0004]